MIKGPPLWFAARGTEEQVIEKNGIEAPYTLVREHSRAFGTGRFNYFREKGGDIVLLNCQVKSVF